MSENLFVELFEEASELSNLKKKKTVEAEDILYVCKLRGILPDSQYINRTDLINQLKER